MSAGKARWRSRRRCEFCRVPGHACDARSGTACSRSAAHTVQRHQVLCKVRFPILSSAPGPRTVSRVQHWTPSLQQQKKLREHDRTLILACFLALTCSEYSKTLNDARLKVLAARETAIQAVVKEARARVRDLARNPGSYKKLLQDLLVQVGTETPKCNATIGKGAFCCLLHAWQGLYSQN